MGHQGTTRPGRTRSVGTKKTAAIAVFVAATFGLMALLSVPFHALLPALHIPAPIKQALNPFEPEVPPILGDGEQPKTPVTQGLLGAAFRQLPVIAAARPHPTPAPPVVVSKGPALPAPVPAINHSRVSGGRSFDPDDRWGHGGRSFDPDDRWGHEGRSFGARDRDRRVHHRAGHHRRRHFHHHPLHCHEQRWHPDGRLRQVRTAAKPVHPHWRAERGRRGGRVR